MLGFQNTKSFLLNDTRKIAPKKFSSLAELKYSSLDLLLVIKMMKKLLEVFLKKSCKKLAKKNLE